MFNIKNENMKIIDTKVYNELKINIVDYLYKNNIIIAKYIIVHCTSDRFKNDIYENVDFVSEVIQPIYFDLKNDLSWNLYFVCLLDENEFEKISISDRLKFEDNKEFTRNFIVKTNDINNKIPVGKIVSTNQIIDVKDPYEDWKNQLDINNLSFCLEPFSNNNINSYINGNTIKYETQNLKGSNNIINDETPKIDFIDSLHLIENFRPNCFGKDKIIDFQKVTLIAGPNGSGKTSIMHAIEGVLTGEVRIGSGKLDSFKENEDVVLQYNENIKITMPKTIQEKKNRESLWYSNRESNLTKVKLNNAFHNYNLFSPEDTFLFAFEELQPDFQKCFTQILFGEEIKFAEKSWNQYKEKFEDMLNQKINELKNINQNIAQYENIEKVDINEIIQMMDLNKIKYNKTDSIHEWQNLIMNIYNICISIKDIPAINSKDEVIQLLNKSDEILSNYSSDKEDVINLIKLTESKIAKVNIKLDEHLDSREKYKLELNKYGYAFSKLDELIFLKENFNILDKLRNLLNNINLLKDNLCEMAPIASEIDNQSFFDYSYEDILKKVGELTSIKEKKLELSTLLNENNIKIKDLEREKTQIHNTISNIKAYGKKYLELVDNFECCPLCGNSKITKEEFFKYLNMEYKVQYDQLYKLNEDNNKINYEINILNYKEKEIYNYVSILDKIKEIERKIDNTNIVQIEFDAINKIKVFSDLYNSKKNELEAKKNEYNNIFSNLDLGLNSPNDYFYIYNISINNIDDFQSNEKDSLKNNVYIFIEYLLSKKDNIFGALENIKNDEFLLKESEEILLKNLNSHVDKLNSLNIMLEKEQDIKNQYLRLKNDFFEKITSLLNEDSQHISHIQLYNSCEVILKLISTSLKSVESLKIINNFKFNKNEIETQINKIITAISTLKELKSSSFYANDFIGNNIEYISQIFCSLHTPKEFNKLIIFEDKLIAIRNDNKVEINEMSTGQKTAVVLSVFICLNNLMKNAPQFIFLDEPVANIDDMNVLSLLDFIRELVIAKDKQIFFTTANYNVRSLFKRKFSFLDRNFTELYMERKEELKTTILEKHYNSDGFKIEEKLISFV